MLDGPFLFAEGVVSIAEQAIDQRVERIDLDGFFQHGARVLEILRCVIGAAQLNIGVDVVGIDVEGLLEQPQRFFGRFISIITRPSLLRMAGECGLTCKAR